MSKKVAKAGIIGAVLGAIAGVFVLAPKSAKENRKDVKDAVIKGKADAEKKLKQVYGQLGDVADDVKSRSKTFSASAKKESESLLKQAETIKQKVKGLISNVKDDTTDIASDIEDALAEGKDVANKLKNLAKEEAEAAKAKAKS